MHYPPCAALANVIAQDAKLEQAARIAKQIHESLVRLEAAGHALKVLGPTPAPLAKIEGRHRIQFLLKASSRARLNQVLHQLADECQQRGIPPQSVMIDVDPVSIM
jgi:primosomal protein N' (replication factor Y)